MTPTEIEEVLDRSIRQSERLPGVLSKQGMSFKEIRKTFDQPLRNAGIATWERYPGYSDDALGFYQTL